MMVILFPVMPDALMMMCDRYPPFHPVTVPGGRRSQGPSVCPGTLPTPIYQ